MLQLLRMPEWPILASAQIAQVMASNEAEGVRDGREMTVTLQREQETDPQGIAESSEARKHCAAADGCADAHGTPTATVGQGV